MTETIPPRLDIIEGGLSLQKGLLNDTSWSSQAYETVRIVDLALFRRRLKRALGRPLSAHQTALALMNPDAADVRARLLTVLNLYDETSLPSVAVVRRPQNTAIQSTFSIINHVIFFESHLSENWQEGFESHRFLEALSDALEVYLATLSSPVQAIDLNV